MFDCSVPLDIFSQNWIKPTRSFCVVFRQSNINSLRLDFTSSRVWRNSDNLSFLTIFVCRKSEKKTLPLLSASPLYYASNFNRRDHSLLQTVFVRMTNMIFKLFKNRLEVTFWRRNSSFSLPTTTTTTATVYLHYHLHRWCCIQRTR